MRTVSSIDKDNMTFCCDGIDYPLLTATLSVDEMQDIVNKSEKIVNEIVKEYE